MPQPQYPFFEDQQDTSALLHSLNMRAKGLSDPFTERDMLMRNERNQEEQRQQFSQNPIQYQRLPQEQFLQNSPLERYDVLAEQEEASPPEQPIERTEMRPTRLVLLKRTLEEIQKNVGKALELVSEELQTPSSVSISEISEAQTLTKKEVEVSSSSYSSPFMRESSHVMHAHQQQTSYEQTGSYGQMRIVEGVFDGQHMVGPDGKTYTVPPNYASKSKLVEGDIMKLSISQQGTFIYKQIAPTERNRFIATLVQDSQTREYYVQSGDRRWKILTASVTYYKGAPGDEVVIFIPRNGVSKWAAVDNIIKRNL